MVRLSVQEYYDHNTRRFLRLGQHQKTRNIHQPLWAPGLRTLEEAVNWSNRLVLQGLESSDCQAEELCVLDLGCGVGSSLLYLAEHFAEPARFIGVSISPVQIELAQRFCEQHPGGPRCTFTCADFLALPLQPPVHYAYAIEAFLHAQSASAFLAEVARVLAPGGQLVLIDDFLSEAGGRDSLSAEHERWLEEFRSGWMAGSLITMAELESLAAQQDLELVTSEDLTPLMRIGRPRDKLIGVMRRLAGGAMRRSTYLRSLTGGYAKQQCLKSGLVQYRRVVLRSKATPRVQEH